MANHAVGIREIYENNVRHLPVLEQIRLASMILIGIADPNISSIELDAAATHDREYIAYLKKYARDTGKSRDPHGPA
jgi:hypothetical protein